LKILFLIPDLNTGGAERVLVNILKHIDRRSFSPSLVLFNKQGKLLASVPGDVAIYPLKELQGKYWYGFQWLNLLLQFRKLIKRIEPDIVFSFMWYPNAVAVIARITMRTKFGLIVSERTSTSTYEGTFLNVMRTAILRLLYPSADLIIAPSARMADDLAGICKISRQKIITIHNPVDMQAVQTQSLEKFHYENDKKVISTIGRLGSEKGFAYFIKAADILRKELTDCKFIIVGEGSERKNLERLIQERGLGDTVELVGFQQNPYKFLSRSTIFVLSSLYEGFPNVLLEALSLGIPSIATRCPTGPDEIITDGVNGILVPVADERALADAIKKLILDEPLRRRLSEAGKIQSQDFEVKKIVKQFEKAIGDVCAASAGKN